MCINLPIILLSLDEYLRTYEHNSDKKKYYSLCRLLWTNGKAQARAARFGSGVKPANVGTGVSNPKGQTSKGFCLYLSARSGRCWFEFVLGMLRRPSENHCILCPMRCLTLFTVITVICLLFYVTR